MRRRLGALLLLLPALLAAGTHSQPASPSTWSIVAWDVESGSFGVAAASCWPDSIVTIAAIVPGLGAGVAQGLHHPNNRLRLVQLISDHTPAELVLAQLSDGQVDPAVEARQYAALTLIDGSITAAAFTGSANPNWASHRLASDGTFAVQGNTLESALVVEAAYDAYLESAGSGQPFPDRLLTALEAGSRAGGDRRCNTVNNKQTSASAFLAVVRPGDPALGGGVTGDDQPWLLLSVTEPLGGANPLLQLRQSYENWQAREIVPTDEPTLAAAAPEPSMPGWTLFPLLIVAAAVLIAVLRRRVDP